MSAQPKIEPGEFIVRKANANGFDPDGVHVIGSFNARDAAEGAADQFDGQAGDSLQERDGWAARYEVEDHAGVKQVFIVECEVQCKAVYTAKEAPVKA